MIAIDAHLQSDLSSIFPPISPYVEKIDLSLGQYIQHLKNMKAPVLDDDDELWP